MTDSQELPKKQQGVKHTPTQENRELVSTHATIGTRQDIIADLLGINERTLRKYYRKELDQALARANAGIGGALYAKAMNGDTAAMIFWLKTRARWRETNHVDHTSSDGSMATNKANSDAILEAINKKYDKKPNTGTDSKLSH